MIAKSFLFHLAALIRLELRCENWNFFICLGSIDRSIGRLIEGEGSRFLLIPSFVPLCNPIKPATCLAISHKHIALIALIITNEEECLFNPFRILGAFHTFKLPSFSCTRMSGSTGVAMSDPQIQCSKVITQGLKTSHFWPLLLRNYNVYMYH